MNWNIFWCVYTLIFAVVMLSVWFFLFYKKRNLNVKCIKMTNGKIVRYSLVRYNYISLPVVEYMVNGVVYNVVGPKFKGGIIIPSLNPFTTSAHNEIKSNLTTRENLPEVIKLNIKNNSSANITKSPLYDLYPIGSEVQVFYNPDNPKMAYVQRFIKPPWICNIYLPIGVLLFLLSMYLLFGPVIKY